MGGVVFNTEEFEKFLVFPLRRKVNKVITVFFIISNYLAKEQQYVIVEPILANWCGQIKNKREEKKNLFRSVKKYFVFFQGIKLIYYLGNSFRIINPYIIRLADKTLEENIKQAQREIINLKKLGLIEESVTVDFDSKIEINEKTISLLPYHTDSYLQE